MGDDSTVTADHPTCEKKIQKSGMRRLNLGGLYHSIIRGKREVLIYSETDFHIIQDHHMNKVATNSYYWVRYEQRFFLYVAVQICINMGDKTAACQKLSRPQLSRPLASH